MMVTLVNDETEAVLLINPQTCDLKPDESCSASTAATVETSSCRLVHFGTVTSRYYEQVLGDHPACTDGLPVALDWKYEQDDYEPSVDEYDRRRGRQDSQVPKLSLVTKISLLLESGVSEEEIEKITKRNQKMQKQRHHANVWFPGRLRTICKSSLYLEEET